MRALFLIWQQRWPPNQQ